MACARLATPELWIPALPSPSHPPTPHPPERHLLTSTSLHPSALRSWRARSGTAGWARLRPGRAWCAQSSPQRRQGAISSTYRCAARPSRRAEIGGGQGSGRQRAQGDRELGPTSSLPPSPLPPFPSPPFPPDTPPPFPVSLRRPPPISSGLSPTRTTNRPVKALREATFGLLVVGRRRLAKGVARGPYGRVREPPGHDPFLSFRPLSVPLVSTASPIGSATAAAWRRRLTTPCASGA